MLIEYKRKSKPKGQSALDNQETLATFGTQDEDNGRGQTKINTKKHHTHTHTHTHGEKTIFYLFKLM
jgi:hypothetical protein